MVYQLITFNVAINSYDHALLTLLVAGQTKPEDLQQDPTDGVYLNIHGRIKSGKS